ncbi:MAG: hypothetical protein DIZ80_01500 [endosymbiont of Galathealinum brachiosum]|uniref:Uncharacterized protein n=1 Tax=endosymbiont of Galathealinum brachiosum TaxID=2200906 RepID=A0A370DL53_9GAMM|nr:MAG: hypothetical protein DIZ80_01500 [endosymbiont of Galathealinum brachiosum]
MQVELDKYTADKAKTPHNIFLLNLALIHLLMTPATLILEIGITGLLVPLIFSLAIMFYSLTKSRNLQAGDHWFIHAHWKLALNRYRLLLISYAVTAGLMTLGLLLSTASPDPNMQDILHTVFIRIAIMPTLLMVMINFFLESSALSMAAKGEIADSVIKQLPLAVKPQ